MLPTWRRNRQETSREAENTSELADAATCELHMEIHYGQKMCMHTSLAYSPCMRIKVFNINKPFSTKTSGEPKTRERKLIIDYSLFPERIRCTRPSYHRPYQSDIMPWKDLYKSTIPQSRASQFRMTSVSNTLTCSMTVLILHDQSEKT